MNSKSDNNASNARSDEPYTKCEHAHNPVCTTCTRIERERIKKLINEEFWPGLSLVEDRANLEALIDGKPLPFYYPEEA